MYLQIFILINLNGLVISQKFGCEKNNDCYELFGNSLSYEEARKTCRQNGLQLARGDHTATSRILLRTSYDFQVQNIESYWLDVRSSTLKSFQFLNGKKLTSEPPGWPRSQPAAGETCGLVVIENDKTALKKAHCSLHLGFICYVGENKNENQSMTFYFSLQKNWFEAREFCLRRGEDLYAGSANKIYKFNPIRQYWIGARKHKITYGGTSKEVINTRWRSGSPNDLSNGCVIATKSGRWMMSQCAGTNHSVICTQSNVKSTRGYYAGAIAGAVLGFLVSSVFIFLLIRSFFKKDAIDTATTASPPAAPAPKTSNKRGRPNPAFSIEANSGAASQC